MQMLGTVVVLVLDYEPGVLIRLQPRERDPLQIVDVPLNLFVGWRVVDVPAGNRAGVLVLSVDAVNEALDVQRVATPHTHCSALGAGRIVRSEQVLHCTLAAARRLSCLAPLEVHLARRRGRTGVKKLAEVLLDERKHTQNFDRICGSAGERAAIRNSRQLIAVVPQAANCLDQFWRYLAARHPLAWRAQTSDTNPTWIYRLAQPVRHIEAQRSRVGPPGGGHAGGKAGAERDAQRFVARTAVGRGHVDSWHSRSGDRRGCKPLASYAVGAPWGANGIGLAGLLSAALGR